MKRQSTIRDLETAKVFAQEYRLDLHEPRLMHDLGTIDPNRLRATQERLFTSLLEVIERYAAFHQDYPFVVALTHLFSGALILGYQVANSVPVRIGVLDLARHLGIYGGTGVGKTTFVTHLLTQLQALGIKLFIFDPKDDSFHIAVRDPNFLVLSANAKLNLLQRPSFLSRDEFINRLTKIWGETRFSGANQQQVFDEALNTILTTIETPCLADVEQHVRKMLSPKLTYTQRDAINGVGNRLRAFGRAYPGLYHTRSGITWNELFRHSLYLNTLANDEYTVFLYTFLVNMLYLHNRRAGIRDTLDYVLVNDEGNEFWNAKQHNIGGVPTLVNLLGMVREFGIGIIHTSVDQASLHPILKSNTNTTVAMSVATGREAQEVIKNQQLNREQADFFRTRLSRGQCLIRLSGDWQETLFCCFPYRKPEKDITTAERREAIERINQYAPADQEPLVKDEKLIESPQEPPQRTLREKPKKPPSQPRDETPAEPRHVPIKLTTAEEALLRATTKRISTTTQLYDHAGLARQTGNNARAKLERLKLATASSILVRPGRGGNAVVLEPTAEGYALLGRARPTRSRGGDGAQHRWLIQELSGAISDASVEFVLGGKSIDLFFRFDPEKHQPILFHMEANVSANAPVAIEVEASDPTKTAENNITKNAAVGIALTIVAVLPRDVAKTRAALAQQLSESYVVVDVFSLLGGLR